MSAVSGAGADGSGGSAACSAAAADRSAAAGRGVAYSDARAAIRKLITPTTSRTAPRIMQQIDWSNGGDGIVVGDRLSEQQPLHSGADVAMGNVGEIL